MSGNAIRVALTGFAGLDNPEPGTPTARALRDGWRGPLKIEALGYDRWMTGAWSPGLVDQISLVPPIAAGDDAVLRRILEIDNERKVDALIPCLDLEVPVYRRLASRLEKSGIRTLLPPAESIEAATKSALPSLCHRHDIAAPRTVHVTDLDSVPVQADQLGYPLIVKGTVADAKKVANAEQALLHARELNYKWGGGVLLQQFLQGDEYVVGMVARADGSCLGMVSMRKLGINFRGKGVVGSVVNDPALEKEARRILKLLNWRGPLELEFIKAARSGHFTLVEINCRLPSWIHLSHWAGCNLPTMLLKELMRPGEQRGRNARPGVAYVRDVIEFPVPLSDFDKLERKKTSAGLKKRKGRVTARNGKSGLHVGVTGVSAFDAVMPGLGVAQSLRHVESISKLVGIGYGAYDTGIHRTGIFDEIYTLPDAGDEESIVERLAEIKDAAGLDVLIPSLDHEISAIAEASHELERSGAKMLLPSADALRRSQKKSLATANFDADHYAFDMPETALVRSTTGLDRVAKAFGFPLVLKGVVSGAVIAFTLEEAHATWRAMADHGNDECLVQRHIGGEEFAVAAVSDRAHDIAESVTIKKLLTCDRGNTWGAIRIELPGLLQSLDKFLSTLGWTGPIEAEFIRDRTTEKFYLIELNPRFPAWIKHAADTGVNLPLTAVCLAAGQPPPSARENGSAIFMRCCEELPVEANSFAALLTKGQMRLG